MSIFFSGGAAIRERILERLPTNKETENVESLCTREIQMLSTSFKSGHTIILHLCEVFEEEPLFVENKCKHLAEHRYLVGARSIWLS